MASLNFTWTKPATREDGSPLGDSELTYKLYMDGDLAVDEILEPKFTMVSIPEGEHDFQVSAFDTKYRLESGKSPTVTVNFIKPSAPSGLEFFIGS